MIFSLFILFCLFFITQAKYYLPGVHPNAFYKDEKIELQANKVMSTTNPVQYEYYDLPFCKKPKSKGKADNLGERLSGDLVTNSPYNVLVLNDVSCEILCIKKYKKSDIDFFKKIINNDYKIHWYLDNLPVAIRNTDLDYISRGYPVGFKIQSDESQGSVQSTEKKKVEHYLFNHVRIIIRYNIEEKNTDANAENLNKVEDENTRYHIVGFEVVPLSIKHQYEGELDYNNLSNNKLTTCNQFHPATFNPNQLQPLTYSTTDNSNEIIFTYDIKWEKSDLLWINRWDLYFLANNKNEEIHYFSILNSFLIVLFLAGIVGMILLRTLKKDINYYNELKTLEELQEESGWKLIHGDIFRSPENPLLFSVLLGTGVQLFIITICTLFISFFGVTSPSNRGGLLTTLILLYIFLSSISGYISARYYKLFNGKEWKKNTLITSIFYPLLISCLFLIINFLIYVNNSTSYAPFSSLLFIFFLWLCISTPLVLVGSYYGYKKERIDLPVRINLIERNIPSKVWYKSSLFLILLGGILPFGTICIELFFIFSSLWLNQYYYFFTFLFIIFILLLIICSEVTILIIYYQLNLEDYKWYWNSFWSSGITGVYFFLYSIWYYLIKFSNNYSLLSFTIYALYMVILSISFIILTGTIGFFSSFWFILKIYSAIKVD